jgi:FtsP/CotA-like multicopper oxidase with cupredoxin domain
MKYKLLFLLVFLTIFLSACSNLTSGNEHAGHNMNKMKEDTVSPSHTVDQNLEETKDTEVLTGKEFTLVAKEAKHQLNNEIAIPVWTFNGSVPGPELRVKVGDTVKINLKNELPDPVTIHWHGIPVPNNMDGIPGVTMNAVQPGNTFVYEFTATVPGTYWYHSHQDGVYQVDKGLYGSFIIEDPKEHLDKDYTIVLDEWLSKPMEETQSMAGMNHSSMGNGNSDMGHNMESMYDIFSINGKSGDLIEPLEVKEGEKVKIRFINSGFMTHNIHLHGHEFKVTSTDGQPINSPQMIQDQLISIAPGERYDIEFIADNPGVWFLECHGEMVGTSGMKLKIQYENSTVGNDTSNETTRLPLFDFANYGEAQDLDFTLEQQYNLEYTMLLNTEMSQKEMVYTINGKTHPDTEKLVVEAGDLVKVKLVNNSMMDDHPMHLHGHFFQVLSKNGKALTGSPVIKDTLNLKPGE